MNKFRFLIAVLSTSVLIFSSQAFSDDGEEVKPEAPRCTDHCSHGDRYIADGLLLPQKVGQEARCIYVVRKNVLECDTSGAEANQRRLEEYDRRESLQREYEQKLRGPEDKHSEEYRRNNSKYGGGA